MTNSSRAPRRITVALILIIAAIQVAIPLYTLLAPRPSRFGWQMYSGFARPPEVLAEDADGDLTPVDVAALIADPRTEIFWAEPLARIICEADRVEAVIVTDHGRTERVPC